MPRDPSTTVRYALDASSQLDGFGITLGIDATKSLTKLLELRANPPEEPPPNEAAELIAGSASATAIDRAIAQKLGAHLRAGQHVRACQIVAARILDAILDDRVRLHADLAAHANPLISRLHEAAELTETVAELVKQRRVDEAHTAATASADAEDLHQIFKIRDAYITPPGMRWSTGWWDCSRFSNPWDVNHPSPQGDSHWDQWRASIARGGRLWFVPVEQATAASAAHEPTGIPTPINPRRTGNATFASN